MLARAVVCEEVAMIRVVAGGGALELGLALALALLLVFDLNRGLALKHSFRRFQFLLLRKPPMQVHVNTGQLLDLPRRQSVQINLPRLIHVELVLVVDTGIDPVGEQDGIKIKVVEGAVAPHDLRRA